MNHLKVAAKLSEDLTFVELVVLDRQEGRGGFGGTEGFDKRVFGYKNVRLRAKGLNNSFIYSGTDFGIEITLSNYLNHTPIKIPTKYWPEVKEAIIEYNKWGADR